MLTVFHTRGCLSFASSFHLHHMLLYMARSQTFSIVSKTHAILDHLPFHVHRCIMRCRSVLTCVVATVVNFALHVIYIRSLSYVGVTVAGHRFELN